MAALVIAAGVGAGFGCDCNMERCNWVCSEDGCCFGVLSCNPATECTFIEASAACYGVIRS